MPSTSASCVHALQAPWPGSTAPGLFTARWRLFCTRRGNRGDVLLFGLMRRHLFQRLLASWTLCGLPDLLLGQTVQGRVLDSDQPTRHWRLPDQRGGHRGHRHQRGSTPWPSSPGPTPLMCSFIGMAKQEFKVELADGQTVEWNPVMTSAAEALGLVVVSAGRFEQDASEVTVSLEVLQPALVENKATTTLETAIEQTPGVSLVDGEPQIRSGSGFSYGAGSRVMVLVDDLPVLSGDAGRPTWGFFPSRTWNKSKSSKGRVPCCTAARRFERGHQHSHALSRRPTVDAGQSATRGVQRPQERGRQQVLGRLFATKQPCASSTANSSADGTSWWVETCSATTATKGLRFTRTAWQANSCPSTRPP